MRIPLRWSAAAERREPARRANPQQPVRADNTHFWIDPARQIGVVMMVQVLPFYDERVLGLLRGFEEIVYRELGGSPVR
jgi:CubicO group peptidase (beta-lactamase class C family)